MQSGRFALYVAIGAALGWLSALIWGDSPTLIATTETLQSLFLGALKMIIAPLIFFSLLTGVMKLKQTASMSRLGSLTLLYYLTTSAIAICIGLIVVFAIHPWTDHPPITNLPQVEFQAIDASSAGAWQMIMLETIVTKRPFGL